MNRTTILRKYAQPLTELIRDSQNYGELAMLMSHKMDQRLDGLIGATEGFDTVAFTVVLWADRKGLLLKLAETVAAEAPLRRGSCRAGCPDARGTFQSCHSTAQHRCGRRRKQSRLGRAASRIAGANQAPMNEPVRLCGQAVNVQQ